MKLYLSYAQGDGESARLIELALRNAGYNIWYEVDGIPGGSNWQQEVRAFIEGSDWFIPLVSQNYVDSHTARWELFTALELSKSLLPVVIRPTNFAILGHIHHIDISGDEIVRGVRKVIEFLDTQSEVDRVDKLSPLIENFAQSLKAVLATEAHTPDRIFIAYSHKQHILAKDLSELLIQHGKAVFWDAKIKAGATWRQTIQKALDDATHVVVIWTSDAAESDEVEREVSYALAERKVIVPILSKEIPKLPYHLHGLHYIVLEENLPAIEADLLKAIAQFSEDEDIWQ